MDAASILRSQRVCCISLMESETHTLERSWSLLYRDHRRPVNQKFVDAVRMAAFWHQRGGPERASVIDPALALAAAAATMELSPGWWVDMTLARVWRVVEGEGGVADEATPAAFAPATEFFVTLEAAFDL